MRHQFLIALVSIVLLSSCGPNLREANTSIDLEYDFIAFLEDYSGSSQADEPELYQRLEKNLSLIHI